MTSEGKQTKTDRIEALEAQVRGLQYQIDLLIQAQQPYQRQQPVQLPWVWSAPTWPGYGPYTVTC